MKIMSDFLIYVSRIWELESKLATVHDHMKSLEVENNHLAEENQKLQIINDKNEDELELTSFVLETFYGL